MGPIAWSERHDPPGLSRELVPGVTAVVDDVVGGQVFDILGKVVFEGRPLRQLLACKPLRVQDADGQGPCCGGRMFIIETFARGCEPRHRPDTAPLVIRIDTS
jgi:hypothetical protein